MSLHNALRQSRAACSHPTLHPHIRPAGVILAESIRDEIREEFAKRDAREAANAFAEKVIAASTNNIPPVDRLAKVAQEENGSTPTSESSGQGGEGPPPQQPDAETEASS